MALSGGQRNRAAPGRRHNDFKRRHNFGGRQYDRRGRHGNFGGA